jgi:predicted nucleotidyltransferase component of viral defense system
MSQIQGITEQTQEVFYKVSEIPLIQDFTLIGGTALAIHYNHRLSEDLDFCTWQKAPLNTEKVKKEIGNHLEVIRIDELSPNHIDFYIGKEETKLSFFRDTENEPIIGSSKLHNNIHIASDKGIAAMKLNVIVSRSKFRDLYDVYALSKRHKMMDMIDWAHQFNPKLNKKAFQLNLLNPDKVQSENIAYLKPKFKLTANEIRLELGAQFRKELKLYVKQNKGKDQGLSM